MKEKRLFLFSLTALFLMFLNTGPGFAQALTVTETVTDATTNALLPDANVVIADIMVGTVTDLNGSYLIEVADPSSELEFSFVGYITETMQVNDQNEINVDLVEDIMGLDELVVIGYDTQRKSDLAGSVSAVKTEILEKNASSVNIQMNELSNLII